MIFPGEGLYDVAALGCRSDRVCFDPPSSYTRRVKFPLLFIDSLILIGAEKICVKWLQLEKKNNKIHLQVDFAMSRALALTFKWYFFSHLWCRAYIESIGWARRAQRLSELSTFSESHAYESTMNTMKWYFNFMIIFNTSFIVVVIIIPSSYLFIIDNMFSVYSLHDNAIFSLVFFLLLLVFSSSLSLFAAYTLLTLLQLKGEIELDLFMKFTRSSPLASTII